MFNDTDEELYKKAKAFSLTLKNKKMAEAIGQLQLAFPGMDFISAKALMLMVWSK